MESRTLGQSGRCATCIPQEDDPAQGRPTNVSCMHTCTQYLASSLKVYSSLVDSVDLYIHRVL